LKQREKCVKAATALVEEGTSVVIGRFMLIWGSNTFRILG